MEQNLSEETANKWQNHSFISNKCVSQGIISNPTSNVTKTNFEQMLD